MKIHPSVSYPHRRSPTPTTTTPTTTTVIIITIFFIIFTPNLPQVSGLTCYECNKTQLFCQDQFTHYDADVPTCDGDLCYKKTVYEDGKYQTFRTCTTMQQEQRLCNKVDNPYTQICICDSAYCNIATKPATFRNMLTVFATSVFSIVVVVVVVVGVAV